MKRKNADDAYERPFSGCGLFLWVAVILFAAAIGCMTAKKAEKAVTKFPEVAERILLNNLPRITIHDTITETVMDSSGFEESITAAREVAARSKQHIEVLQARIKTLSEGAKEVCADVLLINDALLTENITLNKLMSNVKPVRVIERKEFWFEDSFKVRLLKVELIKTADTLRKVQAALKTFKDKAKGNVTLYFPIWLLILILLLGGGAIFTKMKTGGFNPMKLLKKSVVLILILFSSSVFGQKEMFFPISGGTESYFIYAPDPETTTLFRHQAFKSWLSDTLLCDSIRYWNGEGLIEEEMPYIYRVGSVVYYDDYSIKWRWFRKGVLKKPVMLDVREIYYRDIGWQLYH